VHQVRPDSLHIRGILSVIHGHFNGTTVGVQTKMMSGLVMGKPHGLVTVLFYIGLVLRSRFPVLFVHGARLRVLSSQLQSPE
jgi:biotin transporter BioY